MQSLLTPMHRSFCSILFLLFFASCVICGKASAAVPLNIVRLLPDPARPRLYAISSTGKEQGAILVIDTLTHATIKTIPVGKEPTDIDLTENAAELLVMNTTDRSISRIDLNTLEITATHQLTEFSNRNEDFGGHVVDGPGNILYYVDEQWGPRLRVYDASTGTVLQTFGADGPGTGNDNGFGDIVVSPDKTRLFGWVQYGDGAGWAGSYVVRYNIAANGTLTAAGAGNSNYPTPLTREPFDSAALMTADGSRLVIKDRVVDQQDMNAFPFVYQGGIYSMSPNGKIVATSKSILGGATGEILHTLPVTATVQAILPDYSAMVYFTPTTSSLVWLDLLKTLGNTTLGLKIAPADGAVVISPGSLDWFPVTGISRYQIYLGTIRGEVEAATPASASYLGETSGTSFKLTAPLVSGQSYFWRVVPVGVNGETAGSGVTRSFQVSNLALSRSSIEAATVAGVRRHVESIELQAAAPQSWSATADVPWISFESGNGSTPGNLVAVFDATSLAAGLYQGNILLASGGVTVSIPVSLRTYAANYMLAKADLNLPWIYAISQESENSGQPSFLLRIDTATNRIESAVPCGRSVTDLTIHYPENRIYLTNWQTGILRALDRTTLQQVKTYQFAPAGGYGTSSGDVYKVAAGKSGRVVIEQEDQWINFMLVDTATGNYLATAFAREGGGVFDPAGRYYYHGENDSSGAEIIKYDTTSDALKEVASARVSSAGYYGSRRVLTSGDGSRVFWNGGVFDPDLNVRLQLPNEVVSSTYHGEVVITDRTAINGVNGETLATLPVTTSVQAVSGDQKKLFLFKAAAISVVDLATIAKVSPRGLVQGIADGAVVIGTAQELSWSLEAAALSYDVYFGSSAAAVTAAGKSSPEYLGNTTGTRWTGALPALEFGKSYWWRVDIVGFSSTVIGSTWSFKIPVIDVVPRSVDLAYPASSPIPTQRLAMTAHAIDGAPVTWTASTTTPWIILKSSSGSAPGNLEFDVNTTGLTNGLKEGSVTINGGGDTFSVPVSLRIIALNVTKLVPHPTRPVVYGINTAATGEGFSHLLEIDAATATILRSIPIGFSPTDADLDIANDRLYVTNWGYPQTRVIDLAAWTELPPLALGNDVYKLEVTSRGRLVTEEQDQWIKASLWNATTGLKLNGVAQIREGDGETDPSGKYYYHSDNNSSGAIVSKYDISGDTFLNVANGPQIGGGSRNLILSGDGSKLFWLGRVLDADLRSLAQMPAEVYATNRTGALAIGASQIWWSDSGTLVAALPFSSTVATVSAGDSNLVRFDATAKKLISTPLANFTDLPGAFPRPGQVVDASPSRLSWSTVTGATSYRVFIAADAAALALTSVPVATVTTNYYDLPTPLAFGKFYTWRVDAVTAGGTVAGKVQSFGIRYPQAPALPAMATGNQGSSAAISDHQLMIGGEGMAQLYDFDPVTGVSKTIQSFTLPGYYGEHYFGSSVALDAGKVSVGAYAFDNPADSGGAAFVFRPGDSGYWEGSGPLTLPGPLADESFSRGLAASGDQMLAGTGEAYYRIGRVAAYIQEPVTARVQTFSANDGVSNDGFGRTIAMEGNQAIIAAPGRGSSYNRLPALYAFSRSTTTGLWTQTQKIAIPGANSYSAAGTAVALSGNYLATNNAATGSIQIFEKNLAGQWQPTTTIKQSTVTGSSSYSFGKALALAGDQLFIGDIGGIYQGTSGGAVFSFRRSGAVWAAGPVIIPRTGAYSSFGGALAVRDGWLLATGGTSQPAWVFRIDSAANHSPRFSADIPLQAVADRDYSAPILADDADGNSGLVFDILQGPAWLQLADSGNGKAILSGVPTGTSDSSQIVQIRVKDAVGAEMLRTWQLSVLAATSVPVLTTEPTGGSVGEGQEFVFKAAVAGPGPFKWQWYLDDKLIAGANRATLTFDELALGDSGTYHVTVSNAVGEDKSADAVLTVHVADRFAGDWPTFGGSPRHTGYHPARLGKHTFVPAWSSSINPGHELNRAATGDGKVFVTPKNGGLFNATALNLKSGAPVWNHPFANANSVNPPTYHDGRVYIQRGNHSSDTQLWSLASATGATIWSAPHSAQWENYESPTVTDAGIWVDGGSYGGMYGFSLSGSRTFFRDLGLQYDQWTPTVSNGRLFSWVAGYFQEHNPADGATLWSVNTGWTWNGWSMNSVSAVAGDSAVVISTTEIVCIDLHSRSIRWRKAGSFQGSPAISGGLAYGIQDKKVVSFALADGTAGPVASVPETIVSGQPLLVMDYLFVASSTKTYVINRANSAVVQTLEGGGLLSFAQGQLLAAGTDGVLRAWLASKGMSFPADIPAVIANKRADDSQLDLGALLVDTDGGVHQWEITGISDPSIFSGIWIDQSGLLQISYAPYVSGHSTVSIRVKKEIGASAMTTVSVVLPALPSPLIKIGPQLRLNLATGLYEQKVTVKNIAGRAIPGFVLNISGLPKGVVLYNGDSAKIGKGTWSYRSPLQAGESVAVTLKYYSPTRGAIASPVIKAFIATPLPAVKRAVARLLPAEKPFAINRCEVAGDRSMVIEFPAEPGQNYRVHYSPDAIHWTACPEILTTVGTKLQWIDRGPPCTATPPASEASRFYRVERLAP